MNTNQSKKRFVKATVSAALVASSIGAVVGPTSAATFTDLSQTNSHYENIMSLLERGVVNGYPDGTYRPNVAVTRGQAAKIIANTLNLDLENISNPKFKDVPVNHQYYPYVAALVQAGILSGYSDQTFKPGDTITRGQMAKMIALGFNLTADKQSNFDDVPQNHQYASYVDALFSTNVTTGKTATTFDLTGSVTRGQLASFVVRAEKAITSAEATVTGTIESVTNNAITINGKTYQAHKDVAFLVNKANTAALVNAAVTVSTKGNEIIAVSSLNVKNGATFDGLHAKIADLKLPASMTTLKNISATTIDYAVAGNVLIENVTAKKLVANGENGKVATTANVAAPVNLTINGSHFEVVQLIGTVMALQKTASTIQYLDAKDAPVLQLNGDFQTVLLSALIKLSGTAIIEKLEFSAGSIESFEPISSIQVHSVTINGQTMSWADAIKQYLQPAVPTAPPIFVPAPVVPAPPVVEENNGGITEIPSVPEQGGNTEFPFVPEDGGNVEAPTTSGDSGNINVPFIPEQGGNTEVPTTSGDSGNINVPSIPEQGQANSVTAQNVALVGDAIQITDSVTNEVTTFGATNQVQQFFAAYSEMIANVQLTISAGQVIAVEQAEIHSAAAFDGTALNPLAIERLTIQGASEISNITNANNLIVTTTADTLTFNNVHANIRATGNFAAISGAAGDSLIIATSASNLVVDNTSSTNITIAEGPSVARMLTKERIASTQRFATTTSMVITFADGSYAGKTLNVNRKDTVVNVKGSPFSEININSNNVDLLTSGQEVNRLTVSNNVSYLALDANVTTFDVTLGQPLTIHSSTAKTIALLKIKANANATEMIDLINVKVNAATFNDLPIAETPVTANQIFKQASTVPNTSIAEFSSALERVSFGNYKINIAEVATYYFVELKDSSLVKEFKKLSTLAEVNAKATAKPYTVGNSFVYYADVTDIVVYKVDGDVIKGVSVASAPTNTIVARLYDFNKSGKITFHTRFSDTQLPSSALNTIYIFKNGSLAKETAVSGNWTNSNGLNTIELETGVTLTGAREIILANNVLGILEALPETYPDDYVNILKIVAKKAADKNNPELMKPLLDFVFAKESGTYDSSFLTKYIAQINDPSNSLNALSDFKDLISKTDKENIYDPSISLKAADLHLTGKITESFIYSTDGIITNTVNDANELLFNVEDGITLPATTTVRVTDSNGLATLVNVSIGADKKITAQVLATAATNGTFLEGATNFRYSADKTQLIATTLTKSAAIINTGSEIKRVTLTPSGTAFTLSTEEILTTQRVAPTVFGLNNITNISGDNIGFYKEGDEFVLYARYAGTETVLVTDGTNTTALNTTTDIAIKDSATNTDFEKAIAKSADSWSITDSLNLLSVSAQDYAPANTKNIFLYNDGTTVTAFANDAFKGSIKVTDSANKISIINVNSVKTGNTVAVNQFEVVKTSLALDGQTPINTGALVQNISEPVVRNNGLELYAIGTGTATVTLTNGKQYTVTVTISNGQYAIDATEVQNLSIKASDLHMTNISTVTGVGIDYQIVNTNSEVLISSPLTTGTVVTFTSTNGEKTLVNVTRDATDGYKYTPYRSVVNADTNTTIEPIGLTSITDVYNAGTAPTPAAARAKVDNNTLYVYNLETNNQVFRVTDGTLSTLINVAVTADGNGYKSTPTAVKHEITGYTIDTSKEIIGIGARIVGNTLYATGEGFVGSKATVQVPLTNGSYYVININYDANTNQYSFDTAGTVTFTVNFSKEELGLTTITSATTTASNMAASVKDNAVTVAITNDTEGRIEVIGTDAHGQQAKAFIYVKRDANGVTKNIERAESTANTTLDLDLSAYDYTTTPTGSWSVTGIARATISSAMKLNFYAQDTGQSLFTLTDGNGKDLLINVIVSADNPRVTTAKTIEENTSADATLTGSVISANGIRLSADGKKVFAMKENGKATLKLTNADNSITKYVAYTVVKNTDGTYTIDAADLPNTSVTLAGAKLLPAELANVVLQQGDEFVAVGEGTVHVLDGNVIKQLIVTKPGEHFEITASASVSDAVIDADTLGLSTASALTIETAADPNFYVGQLDGKIVAYSKLTGSTTGSYEFVVKAQETNDRAVVRITDTGTAALTHTVAKAENIIFNNATTVSIKDSSIARFDNAAETLYLLKEGSTYATDNNGRLFAIDVTRTNGALSLVNDDVLPLQITDTTKTFTAIAGTDTNIIEIDGNTIHAKALGTTKVKLGDSILTVTIAQNEDGQYRMTTAVTSSKVVTFTDAGLTNFASAEVKAGVADAVSLSLGTDGLTIFSNGAKTAQSLLVHVEDATGNKTAINVTLDATGAVTAADVVKHELTGLAKTASETVQTIGARGVWNGTTITVYSLAAGNAALEFDNALVNVTTTADGNKLNTPTVTPLTHGIASIETSTNAALVNDTYLTAVGNGLVYAGGKIYSVDVKEENNQYVKTISAGVPAIEFELPTNGTYAEADSTLTASKVIVHPGETNKLIIYADGTGTSELAITSAGETTIYQTKATASSIDPLEAATAKFTDNTMNGASVALGDALRVNADTMYFLKEGNTVLKAADDKLINATVSRDADGYFTAAPAYVTKELKEASTLNSSNFIAEDKKLFVKAAGSETFYTANYRVTATATEANNAYSLAVDERHMVKFDVADYFTGGTVTALASPSTHAFGEVIETELADGSTKKELVIYAGTTTGPSTVTFTNGTNNVTFNVTHDATGKVTATAQTAVSELLFADLELTDATIAENSFNSSIIELVKTSTGIKMYPKANGLTSFALTDGTNTVRLVNVKVETVDGAFKVTATPVTFTATGTALSTALSTEASATASKYYATAEGTALYGDTATNSATFVSVTKSEDKGYYSVQTKEHSLATLKAESLNMTEFTNVSLVGSSVNTKLSADKKTLYIYGTNNGYTDVLVDDGTNYATIVTSHFDKSLKVTPAKKAMTDIDLKDASWDMSLVALRDVNLYATHAGKEVASATITRADSSTYKAYMNITVTRKSNYEFEIVDKVVREAAAGATLISGSSIAVDGNYIYAQHVGSSVIQVGTEFKTVEVTQSADGFFDITVGDGFTGNEITAGEVGLSKIENYKLSAITGTDVVEVKLIGDSAHLFAKKAGEVHLVLSEGTDANKVQTSVHVLVEDQSGTLTLTSTPSKLDLDVAPQFKTTNELFRLSGDGTSIYAIKDGSIFATIGGELHKLTVSNNKLYTTKTRIEAELPGEVTAIDNAVLKSDDTNNKLVIAKDFGTTNVTVGGAEYQLTVKQDGSIEYKKLSTDVIDVSAIFASSNVSTVQIGSDSIIGTPANLNNALIVAAAVADDKITLTPVKEGTATVLISDGTNTIQAQVTVADNNGLQVTHVVPVSKYYTSTVGYYPTKITQPNGDPFTSANGLVTLKDGEITVYPGAVGTAQMLIEGEGKKGLFELTVTANDYKFGHFVQTIGYDKFTANASALATIGNIKVTQGITGLDVIFEDLQPSYFVAKATNGYKVVKVQAEVTGDSFSAIEPDISEALVVTGEVTNVNGLHTVQDGENTIIFADAATTFPASYTLDGVIYEVTAGTAPKQLTSKALTKAVSNTAITAATFMQGDDVVAFASTEWTIKSKGTGIYKVTEGSTTKYIELTVAPENNSYITDDTNVLNSYTNPALTNLTVLAPSKSVYVDSTNHTIYGETTEAIIISAVEAGNKVIYKGEANFTGFTVAKTNVLADLEWTEFKEHSLNSASTIMRIDGTDVYALAPGEEYITFKSPNGLERTMKVVVNADYTIAITAETPHMLTYSASAMILGLDEINFTFDLNIPENISGLDITPPTDNTEASVVNGNKLKVIIQSGTHITSTFTIILPELVNQTPIPITVVTKDFTDYTIVNDPNSILQFHLVQP